MDEYLVLKMTFSSRSYEEDDKDAAPFLVLQVEPSDDGRDDKGKETSRHRNDQRAIFVQIADLNSTQPDPQGLL